MDYLLIGEETERILFRKLQPSDFDLWLPFHRDPNSTKHWSEEPLGAQQACQRWFNKVFYRYENQIGGLNALIHKTTGELIGQCGLLIQNVDGVQEMEIGYSMLPLHRNKGYASEASKKCKSFAFGNELVKSLISIIHIDNLASQKVAINNGMELDKTTTYNNNPVYIFRVYSK